MATVTLQIDADQIPRFAKILQSDYDSLNKEIHETEIELEDMKERAGNLLTQLQSLKVSVVGVGSNQSYKVRDREAPVSSKLRVSLKALKEKIRGELLRADGDTIGATELGERTGAQASSVYRALNALKSEGIVMNSGREWKIATDEL